MVTLTLNTYSRREDRYSLCYVLGGDCHYELFARMTEVQKRVPALVAAGAGEFSVLKSDGMEIVTHDDLVRHAGAATSGDVRWPHAPFAER